MAKFAAKSFFLFFAQHIQKYHNNLPEKMLKKNVLLLLFIFFNSTFSRKKTLNNTHFW